MKVNFKSKRRYHKKSKFDLFKRKFRGVRSPIYLLPSIFTIMSLLCGFYAIVYSFNHQFIYVGYLIIASALFDSLDGRIARLTRTASNFGAQLDSMCDVVNFGVSPAIIAYNWQLDALDKIGGIICFIYLACTTLRLARFNASNANLDKRYFYGLPCPSAAILVVGYIWISSTYSNVLSLENYSFFYHVLNNNIVLPILILFASFSMVSNIGFYSFKNIHFKRKTPFKILILIIIILVLLLLHPDITIYASIIAYALSGYIAMCYRRLFKKSNTFKSNYNLLEK